MAQQQINLQFLFRADHAELTRAGLLNFKRMLHSKAKVLAMFYKDTIHFFSHTYNNAFETQLPVLLHLTPALFEIRKMKAGRHEEGKESIDIEVRDLTFFSEGCQKDQGSHSIGLFKNKGFKFLMLTLQSSGSTYNRRFEVQSVPHNYALDHHRIFFQNLDSPLAQAKIPAMTLSHFFSKDSTAQASEIRLSLQFSKQEAQLLLQLQGGGIEADVTLTGCEGRLLVETKEPVLKYHTVIRQNYWQGLYQLLSSVEYVFLRLRSDAVIQLYVDEDDKMYTFALIVGLDWEWNYD